MQNNYINDFSLQHFHTCPHMLQSSDRVHFSVSLLLTSSLFPSPILSPSCTLTAPFGFIFFSFPSICKRGKLNAHFLKQNQQEPCRTGASWKNNQNYMVIFMPWKNTIQRRKVEPLVTDCGSACKIVKAKIFKYGIKKFISSNPFL